MSTVVETWPTYETPGDLERVEQVPLEDRDLPSTTYELVRRSARAWPERVALSVMPDASRWRDAVDVTFSELARLTGTYANALQRAGVTPRTRVALVSTNCLQYVPALLAAEAAGIAVPLNGGQSVDHLAILLERSGTRHAVVAGPLLDEAIWSKIGELVTRGLLDHVLVLDPTGEQDSSALDLGMDCTVARLADAAEGLPDVLDDPHHHGDVAAVFHTGGTTGVPKLAAHTHRNQVADAWMIAADSTLDDGDTRQHTIFAALPLFHVNALHVTLLAPLMRGQRVLWAGPLGFRDPALYGEIWKIVEQHRVATLSAVPTVYNVLSMCPVENDISSLRFAIVGAAPLPAAVRSAFESHTGVSLLEGYGLTEGTCATARSFVSDNRPGSVGQRLPYQQVRVATWTEDGWTDVPKGEVGTLLVSGPTVFAGYVTGAGEDLVLDPLGKVVDGWLDTGDLARLDDDGFIHLAGRAKDVIIRGGHNIEPAEIETALLEHPDVADAAAVGQPDPRAGELPVAYVTLRPGAQTSEAELLEWVGATALEPAARPKRVTVLDMLPLTDVGKPYKLGLRADAAARAVQEAVAEVDGAARATGSVRDGVVVVTVETHDASRVDALRGATETLSVETEVRVS